MIVPLVVLATGSFRGGPSREWRSRKLPPAPRTTGVAHGRVPQGAGNGTVRRCQGGTGQPVRGQHSFPHGIARRGRLAIPFPTAAAEGTIMFRGCFTLFALAILSLVVWSPAGKADDKAG